MESFFSTLKIERVNRRGIYKTRKEVKADVFDYTECLYNPKRRHSTIGYVSPAVFDQCNMLKSAFTKPGTAYTAICK